MLCDVISPYKLNSIKAPLAKSLLHSLFLGRLSRYGCTGLRGHAGPFAALGMLWSLRKSGCERSFWALRDGELSNRKIRRQGYFVLVMTVQYSPE